jgi:hypothetical protein
MVPRNGYPSPTALTSESTADASTGAPGGGGTMLLKRMTGVVTSPRCAAVSARLGGNGPIARHHDVGAEQEVRLRRQRALHAIGEEADGADAADRQNQCSDENTQLAGTPVAAKQAPGEAQRVHGCYAIVADEPACR